MQERRAPVEVRRAEALGGDRVEQLAERLDLFGQRGLREQALDLGGDAEIGRRARQEVVAAGERGRERVADLLERAPARVAEHPNRYSHRSSSVAGRKAVCLIALREA